jgi:hypothetical protein
MTDLESSWKRRLHNYRRALARLREAVHLNRQRRLSDLEQLGLIQAFEFTHELPSSDIDLCIDAEGLSMSETFAIENALDDLLLPWKIDLLVWHVIDQPALNAQIDRDGITLMDRRAPQENT